jgi:hypothetical protein
MLIHSMKGLFCYTRATRRGLAQDGSETKSYSMQASISGSMSQLVLRDPGSFPFTTDDNYKDPEAGRQDAYKGRWLAGFAAVGNTEFAVIVQQRFEGDRHGAQAFAHAFGYIQALIPGGNGHQPSRALIQEIHRGSLRRTSGTANSVPWESVLSCTVQFWSVQSQIIGTSSRGPRGSHACRQTSGRLPIMPRISDSVIPTRRLPALPPRVERRSSSIACNRALRTTAPTTTYIFSRPRKDLIKPSIPSLYPLAADAGRSSRSQNVPFGLTLRRCGLRSAGTPLIVASFSMRLPKTS